MPGSSRLNVPIHFQHLRLNLDLRLFSYMSWVGMGRLCNLQFVGVCVCVCNNFLGMWSVTYVIWIETPSRSSLK